jgi:predicted phage replisome organizer
MAENGKFYWLKLKRDFFKRHDVRIIKAMPNGRDYILFYLQLLLESIDHEGTLRFSEAIPYSDEMLSVITDTDINIVKEAKKLFIELNLIQVFEDQTIYMCEVEKLIGSTVDNDNANRQRRYREKQKIKALRNVTESVTENNESKSIEIEKELELEKELECVSHTHELLVIGKYGNISVDSAWYDSFLDKYGKDYAEFIVDRLSSYKKAKNISKQDDAPYLEQFASQDRGKFNPVKAPSYGDADSFFEAALKKSYDDEEDEEII